MKAKDLISAFKMYIIELLLMSGLFSWLKAIWDALETAFDGGVQESVSDTVIAAILVLIVWYQIRKWIVIRES